MLGYLMHKHPTHVMPHCVPKLARGGHGVDSVCCPEKTDTPVCDDAPYRLKQKKTVCSRREPPTYRLDSDSDLRPWELTLAGPTDGRWQGGFSRFFCVGKLCAATKRSPFLLNFLSHMSHGYLGQTASQVSFLCLFYIGAVDISENRMEHLSSLLRAFTYWGSLCSSFFWLDKQFFLNLLFLVDRSCLLKVVMLCQCRTLSGWSGLVALNCALLFYTWRKWLQHWPSLPQIAESTWLYIWLFDSWIVALSHIN